MKIKIIINYILISAIVIHAAKAQTMEFSHDKNGNQTNMQFKSPQPDKPVITANNGTLTSSAASSYQWYLGDSPIQGATGQSYKPTADGSYKVKVKNASGCESEFSQAVSLFITGVINLPGNQYIKIGPNPARNSISVYFKLNNTSALNIMIYDVSGKTVATRSNIRDNDSIDISSLAAGQYLIRIYSKDNKTDVFSQLIKIY